MGGCAASLDHRAGSCANTDRRGRANRAGHPPNPFAAAGSEGLAAAELGLDQPACVLFTSGSTGRPKGIVNSQRCLLQRVRQSINAAHINAEDRFLTLSSLCTIVGVRDTITALLAGASVPLLDLEHTGAREILNIINVEAITVLFGFPALLRSLIECARKLASNALRLVRVGGDTTLWSDIDLFRGWLPPGVAIQSIYVATEAPMMQWFVDPSSRTDNPCIPIGYPLPRQPPGIDRRKLAGYAAQRRRRVNRREPLRGLGNSGRRAVRAL